jgi:hydroxypyruvate isomerase
MPRFAANLSMLYPELPFLDRFAAAAQDGFSGVEFLFPYEFDLNEIAARLRGEGLQQVLFNAPPGDFSRGQRGLAALPDRQPEFRESLPLALEAAARLGCPRVHVMAGLVPPQAGPGERDRMHAVYLENLAWAAPQAAACGVDLLIEPINPRDIPGYFLNRQDEAHGIVAMLGAPNLKVQMDLYHCQIVEGDVAMKIRQYLPTGRVGHFQIAGVPLRHEPDHGELHHPYLFQLIDEVAAQCAWEGWVGCEYRPAAGPVPGGTSAGLGWLRAASRSAPDRA